MSDAPEKSNYSRDNGIGDYKKRRRRGRAWRTMVILVLVAVLGGASYFFAKQFVDTEKLPFDVPNMTAPAVEQAAPVEQLPTVQPAEVKLLASGDVVLEGSATESGRLETGAYEFEHLFRQLKTELQGFDVSVVEQETALAGTSFGFGNSYPLNAPQDLGRAEMEAGFNVVLRASDHTLDTGVEGVRNELKWWRNSFPEVPVLGIADVDPNSNPTLANYVSNVYIYDKDGFKIALLNHSTGVGDDGASMVSTLTEEKIASDVAKARELGAEMIVAFPHWGEENNSEIVEEQERIAQAYADQGVDLIIGNHPRVLQRTAVLKGRDGHKTICFYSLGCLVSGQSEDNLLGGLAEVTLARNDKGECEVKSADLKPVIVHRGNGEEYRTYLLANYTDDLAYSSWDGWIGVEEWNRRCEEALGKDYDANACVLHVDVNATPVLASESTEEEEEPAEEEGEEGYEEY